MAKNPIFLEISTKNLIHNATHLKKTYNSDIVCILKANAYGHGVEIVSDTLFEHGFKNFGVARLIEAKNILKNSKFKNASILVFEDIDESDFPYILENPAICVTANTFKDLLLFMKSNIPTNQIQIKIDFGFGRNGISESDFLILKDYTLKNNLSFKGIYTHLYSVTFLEGKKLIEDFTSLVESVGRNRFEVIHLQNSFGVHYYGKLEIATHIRSGVYLYGLQDTGYFETGIKPSFSLKGTISSVRDIESSNYLAYTPKSNLPIENCKYIAKIKIGYGDGFSKINENTDCLINGKPYKILSITMDNTFISVDESVKENDDILLLPNIENLRKTIGASPHEVLTQLGNRIERVKA